MNSKALAEALRALADAVEAAPEAMAPAAPTSESPACAWVPLKKCGLPERTVRRLVRARAIGASRIGRDVYVLRSDVDRYCESQRIDHGAAHSGDEVDQALARRKLRLVGGRR